MSLILLMGNCHLVGQLIKNKMANAHEQGYELGFSLLAHPSPTY